MVSHKNHLHPLTSPFLCNCCLQSRKFDVQIRCSNREKNCFTGLKHHVLLTGGSNYLLLPLGLRPASVCFVASVVPITSACCPCCGARPDLTPYLVASLGPTHFAVSHGLALLPSAEASSTRQQCYLCFYSFPLCVWKGEETLYNLQVGLV
jgi:hypothetical protein